MRMAIKFIHFIKIVKLLQPWLFLVAYSRGMILIKLIVWNEL